MAKIGGCVDYWLNYKLYGIFSLGENMSGHSKWSQIKRQKGAADVKRGAAFSKLANAIIVAAKNGGGNPDANFTLKMAIDKAKTALMPKDTIDRAIKRGTGELAGALVEQALYEAIGPSGVGVVVEVLTDNKNRTGPEVKNVIQKFGGKIASTGSVSYHFNKMGKILVDLKDKDRDEVELAAIDVGAEDFDEEGDTLAVYTKPNELKLVKENLEAAGFVVRSAELSWEPKDVIEIEDKAEAQKILSLMEALESLDDVTGVYGNFNVKEELIQ